MSPEEDFALGETDLLGDCLIKLQVHVDSFIDLLRKFSQKVCRSEGGVIVWFFVSFSYCSFVTLLLVNQKVFRLLADLAWILSLIVGWYSTLRVLQRAHSCKPRLTEHSSTVIWAAGMAHLYSALFVCLLLDIFYIFHFWLIWWVLNMVVYQLGSRPSAWTVALDKGSQAYIHERMNLCKSCSKPKTNL